MRPLSSSFPQDALPTLDLFMKQTKATRVFRRTQAVREVAAGQTVKAVSETFHCTNSALRKWVQRFTHEGTAGLRDRPRSGRSPTLTCDLEAHLNRLLDQDPLNHGSVYSQWSCHELAQVLAQQTGMTFGRETIRLALKKRPELLSSHGQARPRSHRTRFGSPRPCHAPRARPARRHHLAL